MMQTAPSFKKDRISGLAASVLFHGLIFLCGGLVLMKPVQYAVETGSGGIEVNLTAAPANPAPVSKIPIEPKSKIQENQIPENKEDADFHPSAKKEEKILPVVKPMIAPEAKSNSLYRGDGSSAIPGKDQTTFHSLAGAMTEAKPNYLKNPAPAYPMEARRNGWEGVVILKVAVNPSGYADKAAIEKTSGHDILDEAALRTVKKWRFMPAKIGDVPIQSDVFVPVRFDLKSNRNG